MGNTDPLAYARRKFKTCEQLEAMGRGNDLSRGVTRCPKCGDVVAFNLSGPCPVILRHDACGYAGDKSDPAPSIQERIDGLRRWLNSLEGRVDLTRRIGVVAELNRLLGQAPPSAPVEVPANATPSIRCSTCHADFRTYVNMGAYYRCLCGPQGGRIVAEEWQRIYKEVHTEGGDGTGTLSNEPGEVVMFPGVTHSNFYISAYCPHCDRREALLRMPRKDLFRCSHGHLISGDCVRQDALAWCGLNAGVNPSSKPAGLEQAMKADGRAKWK